MELVSWASDGVVGISDIGSSGRLSNEVQVMFGVYHVVKKNVTQGICSKSVKTKDIFLKIGDSIAE